MRVFTRFSDILRTTHSVWKFPKKSHFTILRAKRATFIFILNIFEFSRQKSTLESKSTILMTFGAKIQIFQKLTIKLKKIIKIVSFEFSRQKGIFSGSFTNFWNIWIFAPKLIRILLIHSNVDFWRENSNISTKKINVARFARKIVKWDFFRDFQTLWLSSLFSSLRLGN